MAEESLFSQNSHSMEPLAARMRPRTLDEFVGQEEILGSGRLLRRAIQADMLSSVIFYGPPGTGKTTLARVIANTTRSSFISINAVLAGVKDLREAIEQAKQNAELYGRRTILFVDEVHRWNKAQQDALLPWVENGTVILIGATTHNPFFEVNSALVSRSRIFQLKTLTEDNLREIAERAATDPVRGYGQLDVRIDDGALDHLIAVSGGDARSLLGALQLAVETSVPSFPPPPGTVVSIDRSVAEESIQRKAVLYDKEGDYHFDVISAFIKSIRGSDPDAALYWLAKMVHSGEDPRYIFRRMLISASEDVGLADPAALAVVESAAAAFDRVGLPEGRYHLAHATLYLATCPKSNSTLGFFDALKVIESERDEEVPNHLRDSSRDKEGFGHGSGYLYPHAYTEHWVAQAYLPPGLQGRLFYQPSDQGYESQVRDRVERLRELQLEVGLPESPQEVLSYSRAADRELDRWIARAEADRAHVFGALRDRIMEESHIARHHRVLAAGRRASLVIWEAVRSAPEGRVVGLLSDPRRFEAAVHHAAAFDPLTRPVIVDASERSIPELLAGGAAELGGLDFERILLIDSLSSGEPPASLFAALGSVAANGCIVTVAQRLPGHGQRLSELVTLDGDLRNVLAEAEERLFSDADNPALKWDADLIRDKLTEAGWNVTGADSTDVIDRRVVGVPLLRDWMSPDRSGGLGARIAEQHEEVREAIHEALARQLGNRIVDWRIRYAITVAEWKTAGR